MPAAAQAAAHWVGHLPWWSCAESEMKPSAEWASSLSAGAQPIRIESSESGMYKDAQGQADLVWIIHLLTQVGISQQPFILEYMK